MDWLGWKGLRPDCVAGHVGLELANVILKKPLKYWVNSHWITEHFGTRDYSRLSCGAGDTQLGPTVTITIGPARTQRGLSFWDAVGRLLGIPALGYQRSGVLHHALNHSQALRLGLPVQVGAPSFRAHCTHRQPLLATHSMPLAGIAVDTMTGCDRGERQGAFRGLSATMPAKVSRNAVAEPISGRKSTSCLFGPAHRAAR